MLNYFSFEICLLLCAQRFFLSLVGS